MTETREEKPLVAEELIRLFPQIKTHATNQDGQHDTLMDGYDEEQIRLMDEICIAVDNDDKPIGDVSKKICRPLEFSISVSRLTANKATSTRTSTRVCCIALSLSFSSTVRSDCCSNRERPRRSHFPICGPIPAAPTHWEYPAKQDPIWKQLFKASSARHRESWITSWASTRPRSRSTTFTS